MKCGCIGHRSAGSRSCTDSADCADSADSSADIVVLISAAQANLNVPRKDFGRIEHLLRQVGLLLLVSILADMDWVLVGQQEAGNGES